MYKRQVQTDRDILLQMTDVTKLFPGVVALNKMRLTVRRGTVHALMGENGAGKSTLMKILSGLYKRDGGEIIFDGEPFNPSNIQEVLSRGISMIYQEPVSYTHLDVYKRQGLSTSTMV